MNKSDIIKKKISELVDLKFPKYGKHLFGSRATNKHHRYPDWDFLVPFDLKQITHEIEVKLLGDFCEIELGTREVLSPIIYIYEDWHNL